MIYVVRHGQSIWNAENRIQGHGQCPLSELGIAQATNAAPTIAKLPIKTFYCSDLLRAKQTAEIFNTHLNLSIIFDKRLREYNTGTDYQGKLLDERPADFKEFPNKYKGESSRDVFIRVKDFLDDLKQKQSDDALIVTHEGVMAMMCYIIDNPKITSDKIPTTYSCLSQYKTFKNCEVLKVSFP